jgi:hypothetical protein
MQTVTYREIPKPASEILAYENDRLVKRYAMDHGATLDQSRRCFKALKEFLIVCAVKPGYKVTSDPVDQMWHTFLLFTKDYQQFCEQNLGMFINHEPFENAAPQAYLETRSFVENYFGHIDEQLWSVDAKADCSSGCGD